MELLGNLLQYISCQKFCKCYNLTTVVCECVVTRSGENITVTNQHVEEKWLSRNFGLPASQFSEQFVLKMDFIQCRVSTKYVVLFVQIYAISGKRTSTKSIVFGCVTKYVCRLFSETFYRKGVRKEALK